MRTFETSMRTSSFWLAVCFPPIAFWSVVQIVAARTGEAPMSVAGLVTLVGLANALPLAALAWTLCSVAAYTVERGRLIEHRVVRDRVFSLEKVSAPPVCANGVITLRLPRKTLRIRVQETERCLALLRGEAPMPAA